MRIREPRHRKKLLAYLWELNLNVMGRGHISICNYISSSSNFWQLQPSASTQCPSCSSKWFPSKQIAESLRVSCTVRDKARIALFVRLPQRPGKL